MSTTEDSETKPVVLAGAGLLRWGTTLSVNPHQKLKTLVVAEQLTVPEPVNNSDACSKNYVDTLMTKGSSSGSLGMSLAGKGLTFTNGTLSINNALELDSLTLNSPIMSDKNAATKLYVDNAVEPLARKNDVDLRVKDHITLESVTKAVEPMATRVYVDSKVADFQTKDDIIETIKNLADKKFVEESQVNLASINFVNQTVKDHVTRDELNSRLNPVATASYVDTAVVDLASKSEVTDSIKDFVVKSDVTADIQTALEGVADKSYVDSAVEGFVKKDYIDNAVHDLATKVFVESLVGPLAEETYVDESVANLAPRTYVDAAVEDLSKKSYVDEQVSGVVVSAGTGLKKDDGTLSVKSELDHVTKVGKLSGLTLEGPLSYGVQYNVPNNDETIISNGRSFLLLNPTGETHGVTISLPEHPVEGQYFVMSTSQDLTNLNFTNFITAGAISAPSDITLTAGSSLHFVYSTDASAWFNVS